MSNMVLEFEGGRVYVEKTVMTVNETKGPETFYQAMHNCGATYTCLSRDKNEVMHDAMSAINNKLYLEVEAQEIRKYGEKAVSLGLITKEGYEQVQASEHKIEESRLEQLR